MRVAKVVLPFGYKCFDDELANSLSDKHMAEVYKDMAMEEFAEMTFQQVRNSLSVETFILDIEREKDAD
jgi:hypothetical protein